MSWYTFTGVVVYLRVLGPLELGEEGAAAVAPKPRTMLALLLVRANTMVPVDLIVDEVWGESPPPSARDNVRVYATVLRRMLAGAPGEPKLVRRGPGYQLTIQPAALDVQGFRDLVGQTGQALAAGQLDTAAGLLDRALGMWRGTALADIPVGRTLAGWQVAVEEERLHALEEHAQVLLDLGAADRAAGRARELIDAEPLRERGHELLARARYRAGDIAGALAALDAGRRVLDEELGVPPGERLLELRRAILNREPASSAVRRVQPAVVTVPRQLPPDAVGFTGREAELTSLDAVLAAGRERRSRAVVISAIAGTAGVGKTALAVHWAHRVADRFPDGQLYVNLRGFDPDGAIVSPAEAVRGFLDALQVPAAGIPVGLQAQVGLYRSLLAERRMLVVVDNARDADQVRPLLPGASGCLVVVTSRHSLSGLVASEGAHPLTLDLLSPADARQFLAGRLGADRVLAERQAVDELIAGCARLPLALAVVAARAATHPDFPLDALASELRESRDRLDALAGGEATTDVRAVFSWSYLSLSPPAARLFRLLGIHPGPDTTAHAAASLAGIPRGQARRLLVELTHAHLVAEHRPGRYRSHDLLRAYATELAGTVDGEAERHAALHRTLDHYLHTAVAADRRLDPGRLEIRLAPCQPGVTPEVPGDHTAGLTWLTAERAVLIAAAEQATRTGFDAHGWQLVWSLETVLDRQGYWRELASLLHAAVAAAGRLADRGGQARAHRWLARVYMRMDRHEDAHVHLRHALHRYRDLGDLAGEAATNRNIAYVYERQKRFRAAMHHDQQALDLFRAAGQRALEGYALGGIGWYSALLGEYESALDYCRRALALKEEFGDTHSQAATWDSLGYVYLHLGQYTEATACYRRALALYQESGDRLYGAGSLRYLGDTHLAAGDRDAARDAWRRALEILDTLRHPDAGEVRAKLDGEG